LHPRAMSCYHHRQAQQQPQHQRKLCPLKQHTVVYTTAGV
jgi:hypothetical protein